MADDQNNNDGGNGGGGRVTGSSMLAGAGLLRWGTTLSINPLQKLKKIVVAEKLTVPEPVDNSDAASKSYVDTLVESGSGGSTGSSGGVPGDGLALVDGKLCLADTIEVSSVKLTGIISQNENAVPKSYVDNAVLPLPSKDYVDSKLESLSTIEFVRESVEPLASRAYVDSKSEEFASKDYVDNSVENLASKDHVGTVIQNLSSISYVDAAVSTKVGQSQLDDAVKDHASRAYVDTAVVDLASKLYVSDAVDPLATKDTVISQITTAIEPLAEKVYVDQSLSEYAKKSYVDSTTSPLASKVFVEQIVGPLAEETFVDAAVANLASKTYVDSAVVELADKSYVDSAVTGVVLETGPGLKKVDNVLSVLKDLGHITNVGTLSGLQVNGSLTLGTQYAAPESGVTVTCDGKTFLLLNPSTSLLSLNVTFPEAPSDGQWLNILTSQDINGLNFINFTTAGSIPTPTDMTMTAGSSLQFVYSTGASGWFVL